MSSNIRRDNRTKWCLSYEWLERPVYCYSLRTFWRTRSFKCINNTGFGTKTKKHFKEKIQIQNGKSRRGNLVHNKNTTVEEALRKENQLKTKLNNKIRLVTLALRAVVRDTEHNQLSADITLNKIMTGEIKIPEEVLQFFKYLIIGPGKTTSDSSSKLRRIRSIS